MFWKPKKAKIINRLEFPILHQRPPIKKYFKTMHQIIDNAISYDENGENEICKSTLEVLRQHIDNYNKYPKEDSVNDKFRKITEDKIDQLKNKFDYKSVNTNTHLDKEPLVRPEFPKDRPNTTSTLKDLYNTRANEPKKTRN